MSSNSTPPASFQQLLDSTVDARTNVRSNVARGRWTESEPNKQRLIDYVAKTQPGPRNGAESLQGSTTDYQNACFLASGAIARRAIVYIEVNLPRESRLATGFMISNRLLITNNHVLNNADDALAAVVYFDRELDTTRTPLQATTFRLDPKTFFLSSPPNILDYAVVAIGEKINGPGMLADFGYCPLSAEPDKHAIGMNMNVVQHPNGYYKQVAIRNNLLTFRTDHTLLYETDTEVGSSGSAVFNDMWEVVALHHWGEPYVARLDQQAAPAGGDEGAGTMPINANEGIRISAICGSLQTARPSMTPAQRELIDAALGAAGTTGGPVAVMPSRGVLTGPRVETGNAGEALNQSGGTTMNTNNSNGSVTFTVPVQITVSLGAPGGQSTSSPGVGLATPLSPQSRLMLAAEAKRVDTDYASRTGYSAGFIPGHNIPLPSLNDSLTKEVAALRAGEANAQSGLLNYEHFSLIMHRTRRVAIYTATNIDGDTYKNIDRTTGEVSQVSAEGDTWYKDPRVSESFWLGQDFYGATSAYFDKGHLTRRMDPTWGDAETASRANTDTFHFTNCSPQHFRFNESAKFWQGVERYVLETGLLAATGADARLCVFQGPIYNSKIDLWIDNEVQIPSSFWKLVVWKSAAGLKAVGMVVDQLQLMSETRSSLGTPKAVAHVDVSQWRVHIADIAKRTGLTFDPAIVTADTIGQPQQPQPGEEALTTAIRINQMADIAL